MTRLFVALLSVFVILLPTAVAAENEDATPTLPIGVRIDRFMQNYMLTA